MRHHETRDAHHEDATLLASCLAGDEHAWTELVNKYTRLVYSIAFKAGLDAEEAAEVAQNVFVIVLRRLEQLQHADRFSAWLITTTHRESWRHKKSLRDQQMDPEYDVVDDDAEPEADVMAWEQASLVQQALARLGDQCRRLLEFLFIADPRPSYAEIAESLGISVGSIGPIRSRCLKRMREQLAVVGVESI